MKKAEDVLCILSSFLTSRVVSLKEVLLIREKRGLTRVSVCAWKEGIMSEKEKKQKDLFAYKAVLSAFLFKADHLSMVRFPTLTRHRRRCCAC